MTSQLADRLAAVRSGIAEATRAAGRSDQPTLIVVTKFHPNQLIEDLAALGVRDVGENRHQEAQQKAADLGSLDLTWHFLGQIQTKKARQVARYADVLHAVDRIRLVEALEPIERDLDCFLQVNLTDDPARGGVAPAELEALVERTLISPRLRLLGVMAVAPLDEDPRAAFARLRGYSERVRTLAPEATAISAGMTHDYAEAVAEGATHLRIGTAITGNRPVTG
ncbi:YggS family pyridoxal phosphate-dependent enzyme [Leucobacter sp. M11]|uniref:YggS family pyridoxal phosphate-dependent enzyme n=1 Tax=Leucobacter sp. M11 TaxID=2993565 RepID=UPI002D80D414|nr:YggS family pyridoxal phosphate-dependent enzyme [Leucobacter sp. M11]MEB4616582.1 YggS family pyridoxal phosphate-dependent enzyme [Leucobacter sp. M11]